MPTLKQIDCSIELGHGNVALPEYRVRYGDGRVKCRIATPEEDDMPFSIHVVAKGYVAPGLACHVFIDGELQCTRNAPCSTEQQMDYSQRTIEFRFRQHESPHDNGTYIGREWSFTKLRRANDSTYGTKRFDTRVGTIEVIVLRCRYDDVDFHSVPRLRRKVAGEEEAPQKRPAEPAQKQTGKKKGNKKEAKAEHVKEATAAEIDEQTPAQPAPAKAASVGRAKSDITMSSVDLGLDGTMDHEVMPWPLDAVDQSDQSAGRIAARCHSPFSLAVPIAWLDGSSEATSSISIRTIPQDQAKDNATSSGISSHSYWKLQRDTQSAEHRGARPTLIFPALPPPLVSAECKPDTDRAVQIGAGALYTHETRRPLYIDDESSPYAVFRFEYCSPKALTKLTGQTIGAEYYGAITRATESHLEGMPKSLLIEELLRRRKEDRGFAAEAERERLPAATADQNEQAKLPATVVQPMANWSQEPEIQKAASIKPESKQQSGEFKTAQHDASGPGGTINW